MRYITAGFSDLLEAAQSNTHTHTHVHRTENSTKLTHTYELIDTKDFFHGVLKFNPLNPELNPICYCWHY